MLTSRCTRQQGLFHSMNLCVWRDGKGVAEREGAGVVVVVMVCGDVLL